MGGAGSTGVFLAGLSLTVIIISGIMHNSDGALSRLPARLKQVRQAQGLSLDAVAKLSGVSRSMVSQIERGESSPTVATLWNLTRALQVDFAGLLDDQPKGPQIEIMQADAVPTIENRGCRCAIRILSPPEDAYSSGEACSYPQMSLALRKVLLLRNLP